MNKEIKNNNDIKVRSGVRSFDVDSTPDCSTTKSGFFFTLNLSTLEKIGAKQLSFYIKLKAYYKNGCFYNYSINKIAKYAGCSNEKAKRHINTLIKLGLIEIHNGNLQLKNISKGRINRKILLSTKQTLSEINDKLLLLLIQRKNNQMNYANKKAKKDTPKGEIADNKSKYAISKRSIIGIRSLSEYLKVSPFYLSNFTKRMIKSNRLKVERVKVNLGQTAIFNDFIYHYLFRNKKGDTIHYVGSIYTLI